MTLLIAVFAAVISTAVWYKGMPSNELKTGILCWLYWGASIMWFCDAIFEYVESPQDYFNPPVGDMINDTFLGFSVVALGLIIWIVRLLIVDPKRVLRKAIIDKQEQDNMTK